MNILNLYKKESTISGTPIIFMATISGIAQGLLLGIITTAAATASYENLNFRYCILFIITFAIVIVGKRYSLNQSTIIIENIINDIRVRIADKIRNSELIFLEKLGKGDLYTKITQDTNLISESAVIIINACQSGIMVVFCIMYIAILSKLAFFITILSIIAAVLNYVYTENVVMGELRQKTIKESIFFEMLNQILDGFKELKMNMKKSDHYFMFLNKTACEVKELKVKTGFRFVTELMYSQIFFYTLIAIIIFVLPRMEHTQSELIIKITAAVLFIIGPLNMVVGAIPLFAKVNIAIENLYDMEQKLDNASQGVPMDQLQSFNTIESFNKLELNNLSFSYTDNYGSPLFSVGPVDLTINQGELLFIVGGNGSGKSTFLKLLTGLYYPISGQISLDDQVIDKTVYQAYRNLFAIIFGNFHLFDRLYGLDDIDYNKIDTLLKIMKLDKKTGITDGKFSNIDLSTGQRKRLAMLVTLLEDKPIMVFDEWAADQDPNFREYFYEILLKDLKKQGKTIIAVSHDDRYFHIADRVLKMEYGKFI